jgi:hypothetical protein
MPSLQIAAPLGDFDRFQERDAKLKALYDWHYGEGSYTPTADWSETRPGFNALIDPPDDIEANDAYEDWQPKINALLSTGDFEVVTDTDGNVLIDAETGAILVTQAAP